MGHIDLITNKMNRDLKKTDSLLRCCFICDKVFVNFYYFFFYGRKLKFVSDYIHKLLSL